MPDDASRQYLVHDAATRWGAAPFWKGPEEVIQIAVDCLVEGVDSPSLRLLAGASPSDRADEIRALVEATLSELGLPQPGEMPRSSSINANGQVVRRNPSDTVRFEVRSTEPELAGHELLVFVNDVEVTRLGAGLGMDPFDVLIPTNQLVATTTPHQVGIARCECGEYGCGSTDVVIVRQGDAVHWDWEYEVPIRGGASFRADDYDAEVARIGADHSWERHEDTTARLVHTKVDRARLGELGLRLDWAAKDHANHDLFKVALYYGSSDWASDEPGYQVFLRAPRRGRTPDEVADDVLSILAETPRKWRASWHATKQGALTPPNIAGRRWVHEPVGLRPSSKPRGWKRLWSR